MADQLTHRLATRDDIPTLAPFNKQLIDDEAHANPMTVEQLGERIGAWLDDGSHTIVLFFAGGAPAAYAAFRKHDEHVYLRQFFVARKMRRSGIGRAAIEILEREYWRGHPRVRLDVLFGNISARHFYEVVGYGEYAITLEKELENGT